MIETIKRVEINIILPTLVAKISSIFAACHSSLGNFC